MKLYGKEFNGLRLPIKRLPREFYDHFLHFFKLYQVIAIKKSMEKKLGVTLGRRFNDRSRAWNVLCSGIDGDIEWAKKHFDKAAYTALIDCAIADNHYDSPTNPDGKDWGSPDMDYSFSDLEVDD